MRRHFSGGGFPDIGRPKPGRSRAGLAWLALAFAGALAACKGKRDTGTEARPVEPAPVVRDAAVKDAGGWAGFDALPVVTPLRTITLPSRPDHPRFDVVGPAVLGDIAVVGSSQLGFAGVDWKRGALAWTKPAGARLAPPAVSGDDIYLIADCTTTPDIPATEVLLGCMRTVTVTGADEAHVAIHGKAAVVEEFSHTAGEQHVYVEKERVRWVRGDHAVSIDLTSGVAVPASTDAPRLLATYKGKTYDAAAITEHGDARLLGIVHLPEQVPMVRFAAVSGRYGAPEVRLLDASALNNGLGQAAWDGVPGMAVLAHAISPVGDVAMAVRLDKSLRHAYIVGFSANALLRWVYPLPELTRTEPIGIALGLDEQRAPVAVVVFHDGDLVTVLPELSSPPTAPGAVRGPSENATP